MLHFASCAFLLAGIFLWLRRKSGDRARRYLSYFCLFGSLCFFVRIIQNYGGIPVASTVLPILNLEGGLFTIILLYLYPIEVISPGWLTLKRILLMSAPWLIIVSTKLIAPIAFRELHTFSEVLQYIDEPNVWFRLLILLVILPYVVMIFVVPHSWMKSSVSNRWIYLYTSIVLCISVLYGIFMLTGSALVSTIHVFFFFMFCILITYQELFVRMRVPADRQPKPLAAASADRKSVMEVSPTEEENAHPLWAELNRLMKEKELWRNPDTTQESMALLLDVSRPTLAAVIRENGFSGYKEYLNRCRIEEFLKILNSRQRISVQEAFFCVGYRSRQTAFQYFQEYIGCTPAEYLNRLSESEQKY